MQGSTWRNHLGEEARIGPEQVLVVAPYNAQVALIKAALPDGARVGTVDKFQGQEAPVVIYSMTSTSADDAPRGVSFLYDLNRLNVAVSRAQALAVVVLSPLLLDAPVRTPEQLRRVNALCRLVESATRRRVAPTACAGLFGAWSDACQRGGPASGPVRSAGRWARGRIR